MFCMYVPGNYLPHYTCMSVVNSFWSVPSNYTVSLQKIFLIKMKCFCSKIICVYTFFIFMMNSAPFYGQYVHFRHLIIFAWTRDDPKHDT